MNELETLNPPETSENQFGIRLLGQSALNSTESPHDIAIEKARNFFNRYERILAEYARAASIRYVMSTTAETFAFYPDSFTVEAPLSWFTPGEEFTEEELYFANLHELGHFIDMRKNPQAFLKNFGYMEEKAKTLANAYLKKHPNAAPGDSVARFFYEQINTLYNILDDIYVNRYTNDRSRFFGEGDGRPAIESLYTKLGFNKTDKTESPLHEQMINSLMSMAMFGFSIQDLTIDPRVMAALNKKAFGLSIPAFIDSKLTSKLGIKVDPEERYKYIRNAIEPIYLELLEKALEDQENKKERNDDVRNNVQKNNSGNIDSFNPFNKKQDARVSDNILEHKIDEQTIKEILNSMREDDEMEGLSPNERANRQNQKNTEKFDSKHDITPSERKLNDRIQEKIKDARKEMFKFWQSLIGKSTSYVQTIQNRQPTGRLNISEFIRKYPEVVSQERTSSIGDGRLRVYDRKGLKRQIVDQPEEIEISLLIDCSGSMDGRKIEAARTTAALLLYSIKDFNGELKSTRNKTHSKLRANTEVILFGDTPITIKQFDKFNNNPDANDAQIVKSISQISNRREGTHDAAPLENIHQSISARDYRKIESRKLQKIIFEITDGASQDDIKTKTVLDQLADEGVVVVGFQIGDVDDRDRAIFKYTWDNANTNPNNKKGIFIGENISELPTALMANLANQLANIRI